MTERSDGADDSVDPDDVDDGVDPDVNDSADADAGESADADADRREEESVEEEAVTTRSRARSTDFGTSAVDVYNEFQATLARIQRDAARREEAAVAACAKATRSAERSDSTGVRDAYLEYVTMFHRAQIDPEQTEASEVYRAQLVYEDAHRKAAESAGESAGTANRECADAVAAIRKSVRDEWEAAYGDYVAAIVERITAADVAAIDPAALSALGHTMMLAACSGASARATAE
jgi:hypothetical protein